MKTYKELIEVLSRSEDGLDRNNQKPKKAVFKNKNIKLLSPKQSEKLADNIGKYLGIGDLGRRDKRYWVNVDASAGAVYIYADGFEFDKRRFDTHKRVLKKRLETYVQETLKELSPEDIKTAVKVLVRVFKKVKDLDPTNDKKQWDTILNPIIKASGMSSGDARGEFNNLMVDASSPRDIGKWVRDLANKSIWDPFFKNLQKLKNIT